MTTISSKRRRVRPGSFVPLVLLLLFALAIFLFRTPLSGILLGAFAPVLSFTHGNTNVASAFFAGFSSNAALAQENASLKQQLASTSILLMDRNLLVQENTDLKIRLGRDGGATAVLAAVLLAPPGAPYDTLTVDAGTQEGVHEGDLVAAGGSVYIGRVASVYNSTSRVVLFSSPGQTYQGLLRGLTPISLAGQGGGSIMGELPAGTEIALGDQVLLPAIAPEYAAQVSAVIKHDGESFQSVYLTLPVNPYGLRFVEIHIH